MDSTAINETASIPSAGITIEYHTDFLALGVVCTIACMAIICVFLYCCCHAFRSQGSYDCSCAYERPVSQAEGGSGSVISSSMSFQFPGRRQLTFNTINETIFEHSDEHDEYENPSVPLSTKDNTDVKPTLTNISENKH